MSDDGWEQHNPGSNGLRKGKVAIFPAIAGAWQVWEDMEGEWLPVVPIIYAAREGRTYERDGNPPYKYWERTREETIAEAKRLAEEYASTLV